MILKIVLGLSALQFIWNIFQYFSLKKIIVDMKSRSSVDMQQKQMSQIENDLNTRLREIQTAQFSPRMPAPAIRLVRTQGDD
jgi:hypothetical protein